MYNSLHSAADAAAIVLDELCTRSLVCCWYLFIVLFGQALVSLECTTAWLLLLLLL
jgi:hypothetical protein